jgi:uncharacterized protein with HEPN domain
MSAENRLSDYLAQMVQGSTDAVTFTEGMDEGDFLADLKTQRAVVMSLMIVGEAASRIVSDHPDFAEANGSVPWRSIRGMRNRIAHGYFDIDLHVVWQTVAELPPLIARLSTISN